MKRICTIVDVYGKTGVCLPMTQGRALRAAAGMGADASVEVVDNMMFTPPPPPQRGVPPPPPRYKQPLQHGNGYTLERKSQQERFAGLLRFLTRICIFKAINTHIRQKRR